MLVTVTSLTITKSDTKEGTMAEAKTRVVTKAHVAAAKAALLQRNEHPSTPRVRRELATMIQHSGNQNQVSEWLKELRDEERALEKTAPSPTPAEPLPREVQEVLDEGRESVSGVITSLANTLASTLTRTKANLRTSADEQVAAAMADADRRVVEAEIEAVDRGAEIERLDEQVERLQTLLEQQAAELISLREALAAARERATTLDVERIDAWRKVEEATSELATLRERVAVLAKDRDHGVRRMTELEAQLEKAMEKHAALATELTSVKVSGAGLSGEIKQLVSERDSCREAARQERERAEQAVEEAQAAKAQVAQLTLKVAGVKKSVAEAVPTA